MNSEQRREKIISMLQTSEKPISATYIANEFSVTRQIIVADIALLRASGHSIRAEHKGYVLERSDHTAMHRRVVVNHGKKEVQDEFRSCNAYARKECRDCWAKLYCSGGCAANSYHATGSINGVYEYGCELFKKRIECAVMIKVAEAEEE